MNRLIFDAHLHIIDPAFPLKANHGYLPDAFTVDNYQQKIDNLGLNSLGGAVVSGSFQAFDQQYLIEALKQLGANFVGVTNLPHDSTDEEIIKLDQAGIRAVRFNLYRGGSEKIKHLQKFADRIYQLVGWHIELYLDSKDLASLSTIIADLPKVSIDHLGLSQQGLKHLIALVEKGIHVKASGFMRTDFDPLTALKLIFAANPNSLMFGTDLPGTRAPRPFNRHDLSLIENHFCQQDIKKILYQNAATFYRLKTGIYSALLNN